MLEIGLVDLDTSHPGAWCKIIKEEFKDTSVAAVWDGESVYPSGYAERFAEEHGVSKVCKNLEEMATLVDVAFIHGCNWDLHLERAAPFLKAGKGVFLDKPMVGNMKDLKKLEDLIKKGHKIIGGSSVRFAPEIEAFKLKNENVISIFASSSFDPFNYGIHTIEMFGGILGKGVKSVSWLGSYITDLFLIEYGDGREVILQLKSPTHHFHLTITTEKGISPITINSSRIYKALLKRIIPYFKGEKDYPVDFETMSESIKVALACQKAMDNKEKVNFSDLTEQDRGFDGAAFAREYKAKKFQK